MFKTQVNQEVQVVILVIALEEESRFLTEIQNLTKTSPYYDI